MDEEFVALKVIAGETDDRTFRRATRELRLFATVRSPYLVPIYDAGQDAGRFYYATPYYALGSLATPARPFTRPELVTAVADVADAAQALHDKDIVHRAIKPANVLVAEDGGGRLADLGLAQVLQGAGTATSLGPIGGVDFLDPGLLRGDDSSAASDVWSLGATLHWALTGQGIHGELRVDDPLLAVRRVLSTPPRLSPDLPDVVRPVVVDALAEDPAARPSAGDLASRLRALARNELGQGPG